jgi:hypothetical protein
VARGASFNSIAVTLNAEGIPAHKAAADHKSKVKKYAVGQGVWYAALVQRVLSAA